jgi:hypothetical protein
MDIVGSRYAYEDMDFLVPRKTLYVFECLMETVVPEGSNKEFEVNNLYYASQMGEFIGGKIPPATLTALVKRGMLNCNGKTEGKNVYSITNEIYDYYINCYRPTKEAYKRELDNLGRNKHK